MIAWLATALVPAGLWVLGRRLAARGAAPPSLALHCAAGALGTAGLLGYLRRPFVEQAAAWVLGIIAWAGVFVIRDLQVFAAFALAGAGWGAALGLQALRPAAPTAAAPPSPEPTAPVARPRALQPDADADEPGGFALELRCPTCGAALAVPVYHRMARCRFCASEHVVVAEAAALSVVVPDSVTSEEAASRSIVRHLRDRRYLELYDAKVRPLVRDPVPGDISGDGDLRLSGPVPNLALVNAADAEVAKAADDWAARIAPGVTIVSWNRFLTPYWHRLGTLYQAAFGRDRDGAKRMEFAVTSVEGSLRATSFPVPEMGKLSYLKALRPLLGAPEASYPALAVEGGPDGVDRRFGWISRRAAELAITPIAMHSTLVPEVTALVYRPWHVVRARFEDRELAVLVDGGSGCVEREAPEGALPDRPAGPGVGEAPALAPSRCPECGADLPYAPDSVAFLCRSCFRLLELRGGRWTALPYLREEPSAGRRLVPFWRFPLRLRTAAGALVTDMRHLTDGIDGSFDQIGDRPQVAETFFVPAFRTRVGKSGVQLYRRLWPELQGRPRELRLERFEPANPPERTVEMTMAAAEARVFARVYLALSFTQRDLARAEVRGVRERFLSAELEGDAEVAFLSLPEELVEPFDGVFGRPRLASLATLQGQTT